MEQTYLDNASTSYPKPECVYRAADAFARTCGASPGRGGYAGAVAADEMVGGCRAAVARLLGIGDPTRVAFASGSTEAINWALRGLLVAPGDHAVVTSLEHNAVVRPLRALEATRGTVWTVVPCSADGTADPAAIAAAIRPTTRLVCATHASNVFGTIQPIAEIARVAHEHSVPILVDGSQTAGAIPFSVEDLGIDLFAFTGHKGLLGPPGTGGLYVRPGIDLPTSKEGGTGTRSESLSQPGAMPERLESGTANGWGLAGLRAGVEWLSEHGVAQTHARETRLVAELAESLRGIPDVALLGPDEHGRKVGILSMNIGALPPAEVARLLGGRFGIAVRAGLHCSPLAHETAGTLRRGGAVRFGVGPFTTEADIGSASSAVGEIAAAAYRRGRAFA